MDITPSMDLAEGGARATSEDDAHARDFDQREQLANPALATNTLLHALIVSRSARNAPQTTMNRSQWHIVPLLLGETSAKLSL